MAPMGPQTAVLHLALQVVVVFARAPDGRLALTRRISRPGLLLPASSTVPRPRAATLDGGTGPSCSAPAATISSSPSISYKKFMAEVQSFTSRGAADR